MSLRQYNTSSLFNCTRPTVGPRPRIMTSATGLTDTTVTCGGTKPGGSHAWIIGRRSAGSRAISACRMAPTRAPEWSRSPHSSIVHARPTRHCQVDEKHVVRPPRYWAPARREPAMLDIKNSRQPQLDNTVRRALGRPVRKLRTAQGLSQEQLAERADLHWTHISGIERAQYDLKLSTLTRVSRGLGVSLAALFAGIVTPRARRKRALSVATGNRSSHRARR